jgi:hypothetical protein
MLRQHCLADLLHHVVPLSQPFACWRFKGGSFFCLSLTLFNQVTHWNLSRYSASDTTKPTFRIQKWKLPECTVPSVQQKSSHKCISVEPVRPPARKVDTQNARRVQRQKMKKSLSRGVLRFFSVSGKLCHGTALRRSFQPASKCGQSGHDDVSVVHQLDFLLLTTKRSSCMLELYDGGLKTFIRSAKLQNICLGRRTQGEDDATPILHEFSKTATVAVSCKQATTSTCK